MGDDDTTIIVEHQCGDLDTCAFTNDAKSPKSSSGTSAMIRCFASMCGAPMYAPAAIAPGVRAPTDGLPGARPMDFELLDMLRVRHTLELIAHEQEQAREHERHHADEEGPEVAVDACRLRQDRLAGGQHDRLAGGGLHRCRRSRQVMNRFPGLGAFIHPRIKSAGCEIYLCLRAG